MKEINLEEIWLNAVETENVNGKTCWDIGRTSMLDFGKKLLELAAENAKVNETYIEDYYYSIYDGKEAHAIHTDGDGCAHSLSLFTIDINSITNTITQVK